MKARVTVLIPTYNGMPFLKNAVESILQQTFKDFLLIVADDGSTDATREYMESLSDDRVRYLHYKHRGTGATCNEAISSIETEYTARMDADDISLPDRLEKQVAFLDDHPEVHMVGGQFKYFTDETEDAAFMTRLPLKHKEIDEHLICLKHALANPTLCFRTEAATSIGGYEENVHGEDLYFFLRMSETFNIENMSDVLIYHRVHNLSINSRKAIQLRTDIRNAVKDSNERRKNNVKPSDTHKITTAPTPFITRLADTIDVFSYSQYRKGMIQYLNQHKLIGCSHFIISCAASPSRLFNYISKRITKQQHAETRSTEKFETFNVLGTNIAAITMESAVATINGWLKEDITGRYICVSSTHAIMEGLRNPELQAIYNAAGFCTPDGMPNVWLGRYHGHKDMTRVYGPDLMLEVMALAETEGYSNYFYGGCEGVAEQLKENMETRFPKVKIAGTHCPPFRELSTQEEDKVINTINEAKPDIIWVGLGAPKQEFLMSRFKDKVKAKLMIGVGAAFDFHSGRVRQAPKWMQRSGLEWFFRLCAEPRRLWKRYFLNNSAFIYHSFLQLTGLRKYPATKKNNGIHALLIISIALLTIGLFQLLGNTADIHMFGRSSFLWMVKRWQNYGGQYSHCYLLPLVSIFIIWRKRKEFIDSEKKVDSCALIFVVGALLLQIISARTRLPRLSLISFVCLLWAIPWYLYGRQFAKLLLFPCSYLLFCVPLTFLDSLTFPLRIFGTTASVFLLKGFGIEAIRYGTGIYLPGADNFLLDVADPCSGLRYFLVMLSLFAAYGYLVQTTVMRKWLLFLAAAPVAILANVIRITIVGIAAVLINKEVAGGIAHDYSGYIVFVTAVILMLTLSSLLEVNYRKCWNKWKEKVQNHT